MSAAPDPPPNKPNGHDNKEGEKKQEEAPKDADKHKRDDTEKDHRHQSKIAAATIKLRTSSSWHRQRNPNERPPKELQGCPKSKYSSSSHKVGHIGKKLGP